MGHKTKIGNIVKVERNEIRNSVSPSLHHSSFEEAKYESSVTIVYLNSYM
jgi:hypothetical protein